MKKKKYWKDVLHAFTISFGRTLSIVFLLALGAMALTGLKVTGPNMQNTAQEYASKTKMADFYVTSDYGLTKTEKAELNKIKGVQVELANLTDVTIKHTNSAVRIFSVPKKMSLCTLISGRMPKNDAEIVLGPSLQKKYRVGDKIVFSKDKAKLLRKNAYTVVGFAKSADIWDNSTMGSSSAGTGELKGYAFATEKAFDSAFYTIGRIRFDNLSNHPYYTDDYDKKADADQGLLKNKLQKIGQTRLEHLKAQPLDKIERTKQKLSELKENIEQAKRNGVPALMIAKQQERYDQGMSSVRASENKLSQMKKPTYTIDDRKSIAGSDGYGTYKNATTSISAVGNVFPVVLYLVAALVTLTTMTRFVDEERLNAGLFRALGYTKRQVISKFVIYGFVTSMSGTFIGILVGNFFLSPMISDIISKTTVVGSEKIGFYWSYTLLTVGAALISSVLPALLVAARNLGEEPAHLMLPKPPASGSKILLEKIAFLWQKLSFTQKVTARNIFRYKQRMLMTIFGVAGSVALLFSGLGIQTSVSGVSKRQFGQIIKYDMLVFNDSRKSASQKAKSEQLLARKARAQENVMLKSVHGKNDSSLFVFPDGNINSFVDLRERKGGQKIPLGNSGAVFSEKFANLCGVKKGDSVKLKINGKKIRVKVSGVAEMYAGHFIYMTKAYYEKATHDSYQSNVTIVRLKNQDVKNVENTAADFIKLPDVYNVSQNTSLIRQLASVVDSLQMVMVILTVLSVLLAIVILYNLTNINVAERIRELSTVKVLGFHNREVTLYIYRETIVLSFVGIVSGLFFGQIMHKIILEMIGSDYIMFDPSVPLRIYLIPVAAIVFILFVLGCFVNRKLKQIDMLEALKSVD